jgi:hypothetical protein
MQQNKAGEYRVYIKPRINAPFTGFPVSSRLCRSFDLGISFTAPYRPNPLRVLFGNLVSDTNIAWRHWTRHKAAWLRGGSS